MQFSKKSTSSLLRLFALVLALKAENIFGKKADNNIGNLRSLQTTGGPPYSPEQCAGFVALNLEAHEYDKYDQYYNQDSRMVLAQTGVYQGPDAIEEYVRFTGYSSPYVDSNENSKWSYNATSDLVGFDPITGTCVFGIMYADGAILDKGLAGGGTVHYATMLKMYYSIPNHKIEKNYVYYTPEALSAFWNLLATDGVNEFICNILTNPDGGCQDVNKLNGDMSKEECMAELDKLPIMEGEDAYADGNTRACRVVHAVFAERNPFHCAHISLVPVEDPNGKIKCQESAGLKPTDMFTEDEILAFQQFCTEQGPLGSGACIVYDEPIEEEINEEEVIEEEDIEEGGYEDGEDKSGLGLLGLSESAAWRPNVGFYMWSSIVTFLLSSMS